MGLRQSLPLSAEKINEIQSSTDFRPCQITKLYDRFCHLDRTRSGFLTRTDFLKIHDLAINPMSSWIIDIFFMNSERFKKDEGGIDTCKTQGCHNCDYEQKIDFLEFCKILDNFNSVEYKENRESAHAFAHNPGHTRANSVKLGKSGDALTASTPAVRDSHGSHGNVRTNRGSLQRASVKSFRRDSKTSLGRKEFEACVRQKRLEFLFKTYRLYSKQACSSNNLKVPSMINSLTVDGEERISSEDIMILLRMMVGNSIKREQLRLIANKVISETDKDRDGFLNFDEFAEGLKFADLDNEMAVRFEK